MTYKYALRAARDLEEKFIPCNIYALTYSTAAANLELKECMGVCIRINDENKPNLREITETEVADTHIDIVKAGLFFDEFYIVTRSNEAKEGTGIPTIMKKDFFSAKDFNTVKMVNTSRFVVFGSDPAVIKEVWNKYWDDKIEELQKKFEQTKAKYLGRKY